MQKQIQIIARKIYSKLNETLKTLPEHSMYVSVENQLSINISTQCAKSEEDYDKLIRYMLKTTCQFNLLNELHELLNLKTFDINESLHYSSNNNRHPKDDKTEVEENARTLLGSAAFYGHLSIVKYLVEMHSADVNAQDDNGNTPLHQTVFGDSYPYHYQCLGSEHGKIAKFLLSHGADLKEMNKNKKTPFEEAKICAPYFFERILGKRIISCFSSSFFYADKVRPVFEKQLRKQSLERKNSLNALDKKDFYSINFAQFCFELAINEYIKRGVISPTLPQLNEIEDKLGGLSENAWKHFQKIIEALNPPIQEHFDYALNDQFVATVKGATVGLTTFLLLYYVTGSMEISLAMGIVTAALTEANLSDSVSENKKSKQLLRENRVKHLLAKGPVFSVRHETDRETFQSEENMQRKVVKFS